VALPDLTARARLLQVLCRDLRLGKDVDVNQLAVTTDGMSGADLKRLCDAAGLKALTRTSRTKVAGTSKSAPTVTMPDFHAALAAQRGAASAVRVSLPRVPTPPRASGLAQV
jgi:AAA family ATPase